MRLLYITFDSGLGGGVGTFSYELVEEVSKHLTEVYVITRRSLGNLSLSISNMFKLKSFNIPPKDVVFYAVNLRKITEIVREVKPDVIHDLSASTAFLPWITRSVPTVVTVHGSPLSGYMRHKYSSLGDRLRLILYDFSHRVPSKILNLLSRADVSAYVFVSKSCLADALVHLPKNHRSLLLPKSKVIYNGISVERLRKAVYPGDYDPNCVVAISRLMEYKGVHRLVKAMPLIVREVPEVVLHIVGDGPMRRHIAKLVDKLSLKRSVFLHGWLPRAEALKILSKCSLLVHPSLYESFGYVIAEAYALGKPVVAHRAPYSLELVESLGAGVTANTFNATELAEKILILLQDRGLYKRLAARALTVAETYFDIRKVAERYIEVYREVSS